MDYDAVVVGAGPAGSIVARVLAEKNIKVLVIDKKQEIGTPKRCAEGINALTLMKLGIKPDPRWAMNEINGAMLFTPSGKSLMVDAGGGYVLERKIFEKFLAKEAVDAGARYMVKTNAKEVIKDGEVVKGIVARFMGEEFYINSKIVIAADGVDSRIARSAGIDTTNSITDYHTGFQYEMVGMDLPNENLLYLYFGNEISPKGYIWIFPKGKGWGNVGIGLLTSKSDDGNRAKDYLDRFIESHPEMFRSASPLEINAGGIPVRSSVSSLVADGLMLVGDAAQQVNPVHGGGMGLAMRAAKIAGEVAVNAIKEGDVSEDRLREYEGLWERTDGAKMKNLLRIRLFLEKLDDEDFEKFAEILSGEDIMRLTNAKYKFLFALFAKKAPKILPLARKFLA